MGWGSLRPTDYAQAYGSKEVRENIHERKSLCQGLHDRPIGCGGLVVGLVLERLILCVGRYSPYCSR